MYARLDTTYASADNATMTFDKISKCLAPRYLTNMKAGHTQEALAIGADMAGAIDSALTWQKRDDAAELAVIYQTHEKELALEESRQQTRIFRILFLAAAIIIILIVWILVRIHRYNRAFTEKNWRLYKLLTPDPSPKGRGVDGEASLTTPLSFGEGQGERLYHRLCELMEDPAVYTDAGCNHETLARLAGTNYHYV